MEAPKDDVAQEHFMILLDTLESNGFIHELSILANRITSQKITPLIGWEKNTWVLDLRRTVIMAFLEVGMYRTTSSFEVHSGRKLPNEIEVLSVTATMSM
jgi:hypothetical protein